MMNASRLLVIAVLALCCSGCLSDRQKTATLTFATNTEALATTSQTHFTTVYESTVALVDGLAELGYGVVIRDGKAALLQITDPDTGSTRPIDLTGQDRDGRLSHDDLVQRTKALKALERYGVLLQAIIAEGDSAALSTTATNAVQAINGFRPGLIPDDQATTVVGLASTIPAQVITDKDTTQAAVDDLTPEVEALREQVVKHSGWYVYAGHDATTGKNIFTYQDLATPGLYEQRASQYAQLLRDSEKRLADITANARALHDAAGQLQAAHTELKELLDSPEATIEALTTYAQQAYDAYTSFRTLID